MAESLTPLYAWARAVLLAHAGVTAIVGSRIVRSFPQPANAANAYPGIALWTGSRDYESYAQGGTTLHALLLPAELAGTNPDELDDLEAAYVSAFEPAHYSTVAAPDGFRIHAVELDEPSPDRVDLDHNPALYRRVVPVAITALPA